MADKKDKNDIQVEARLTVTGGGNGPYTEVRRFDRAWVAAQALAQAGLYPVTIKLDGFVRKDSTKDEFVIKY